MRPVPSRGVLRIEASHSSRPLMSLSEQSHSRSSQPSVESLASQGQGWLSIKLSPKTLLARGSVTDSQQLWMHALVPPAVLQNHPNHDGQPSRPVRARGQTTSIFDRFLRDGCPQRAKINKLQSNTTGYGNPELLVLSSDQEDIPITCKPQGSEDPLCMGCAREGQASYQAEFKQRLTCKEHSRRPGTGTTLFT